MRSIYIVSILIFSLVACNSKSEKQKDKVKKEKLFGTFNDRIYVNPFFNFKVEIGDEWDLDTIAFHSAYYGGDLFQVSNSNSYNQEYPINILIEADRANTFGSKSPIEKLKESKEGYEMIFDSEAIETNKFDKAVIAGENFAHGYFKIVDDYDTSFVHEYYRFHEGFFLSIICAYNTQKDEIKALEFINSIVRNK